MTQTPSTISQLPDLGAAQGTDRAVVDRLGTPVSAGAFVVGQAYQIVTAGNTSFTAIGAESNTVGAYFVATGVGAGSGTAAPINTGDVALSAVAALVTKASLQLNAVDNTSDADKPVSTAVQTALAGKANAGAIGSSGLTMATLRILGRTSTGAGAIETIEVVGAALANGVLTITGTGGATDLNYDPTTRTVTSSTGGDAVLTLADGVNAGLMSSADYLKLLSLTFGLLPVPVYNNSGATIAKGVPVYVTGSSGTRVTIAPADASVEATAARTLGLTSAAIGSNTEGTVIAAGPLEGLNTSALTEGQIIWLSETTGAITSTRPTQPAHGVVLGYCIKQGSGTAGIIYVKVDNGLEIDELHDVLIAGKATGQALMVASDGLWKNRMLVATDLSNSSSSGRTVLTGTPAQGRSALELGSAAQSATTDFATAAQGAKADTAVQPAALTSGLAGKADLVGGVVPTSQIPSIALVQYLGSVATQAAMLALRGQGGDWCIRTDTSTEWVIVANDGATLADWIQLPTGIAPVSSINGQTGAVTLAAADVGAAPAAHTQAWSTITGTPTTLGGYGIIDGFTQAQVRATPLSGFVSAPGTVAATDSILQALQKIVGNTVVGTTSGTLCAGDDARVVNAMRVVNHGSAAGTARPAGAAAVYWVGTVEPANALDNDLWVGGV